MNSELIAQDLCTQGFHLIENFLDEALCQSLRQSAEQMYEQNLFRSAKIGRSISSQQNEVIRSDKILWLDEQETTPEIQQFLSKINQLVLDLNQSLFLGIQEFETHFANYQPGTFYKKHVDQFANQKTRKVSFVYYLNNNWQKGDGGELQLYTKEDQLIQSVSPQSNRFICFNSDLPHEVLLTQKPRYSITGWMKTGPLSLISL